MTHPDTRPGHEEGRCDRVVRHGRRARTFQQNSRVGAVAVTAVGFLLTATAASPQAGASIAAAGITPVAPVVAPSRLDRSFTPAPVPPVSGHSGVGTPPAPDTRARPVSASLLLRAAQAQRIAVRVVQPKVSAPRPNAAVRVVGPTYVGRASWYGPGFQGRRTANGERFDTHAMTAAHKSLPFGTRLRVCRAKRCVVVRINDRGPYIRGRFLDLSYRAAHAIGVTAQGVCTVTATVVASSPSSKKSGWKKKS